MFFYKVFLESPSDIEVAILASLTASLDFGKNHLTVARYLPEQEY